MKTPILIVGISIFLIFLLVGLAFVYIDLTGHKSFYYEVRHGDVICGAVVLDRYVTENKLVYKSLGSMPFSAEFPAFQSSLYLDKTTKIPDRYSREELGVKGQRALRSLIQKQDLTDYLFLENPRFLRLENFSTGEKTSIYSPEDLMLVTGLMERYNYWKKGTQYLEVMIPAPFPYPPLRDKVAVRYVGDDYVQMMGKKVESEIYTVKSEALNEVRLEVSPHSHRLLGVELAGSGLKFVLAGVKEGPAKLSVFSLKNLPFARVVARNVSGNEDTETSDYADILTDISRKSVIVPGITAPRDIFFESGNLVLSGKLWVPEGPGPFPAVLVAPGEGPRRSGEKMFTEFLGGFLTREGYMVMSFDPPGQGKSQGSFQDLDDSVKKRNIASAIGFIRANGKFSGSTFAIVALGTSGNAVLEVIAEGEYNVPSVLISPFRDGVADMGMRSFSQSGWRSLVMPSEKGGFERGFLSKASGEAERHTLSVMKSKDDTAFFMGVRLPMKGYRDYLRRKPYQAMVSLASPILVILDRDDPGFDKRAADSLKSAISSNAPGSDVMVLSGLEKYGGKVELVDGNWKYEPREELFENLKSWINKTRAEKTDSGTGPA